MGKLILDPRILLLQRAGITDEQLEVGTVDQTFEHILEALGAIHRGKDALYGNYMETHGSEPENFSLVQHFCDLKRKYVRAETFIKKRLDGQNISLLEMLDTYSDLAVYGAMGVQLVLHLMTRGNNEQSQRSLDPAGRPSGAGGEGGFGDNFGWGGSRAAGVPAGAPGGGPAAAPGTPAYLPRSPEPSPNNPLEVSQETISSIAERYRSRPFLTNQSSGGEDASNVVR